MLGHIWLLLGMMGVLESMLGVLWGILGLLWGTLGVFRYHLIFFLDYPQFYVGKCKNHIFMAIIGYIWVYYEHVRVC